MKTALNVNFSPYYFVVFLIFPTQLYNFDAIDVPISAIEHFVNFAATSLPELSQFLKVLFVSIVRNNWEVQDTLSIENVVILIQFDELLVFFLFLLLVSTCDLKLLR